METQTLTFTTAQEEAEFWDPTVLPVQAELAAREKAKTGKTGG